eukprot:jgi/Mesvir1/20388/Mv12293-RA.1
MAGDRLQPNGLENHIEEVDSDEEDRSQEDPAEAGYAELHFEEDGELGPDTVEDTGPAQRREAPSGLAVDPNSEPLDEQAEEQYEAEEQRRAAAARAAAIEAERVRATPLSEDQRRAILGAMQGITFTGAEPAWARSIPEDAWMAQIRERVNKSNSS